MGFTTVLGAPAPTGFYNSSGYEELPSPFVRDSQGNQYIAQRGQLHNPGSHHEQYTTAEQFLRNPTMDSPMYRMLQSAGYHVDLSSSSNWPVHESRHAPYIGHQQGGYQGHGQQEQYRPPQQMMNGYPGSQSGAYQGQGQQFHQQFSGNIHGQGQDQFNHAMSNHGHGQGQSRAPNSGSHQMHPGSASHHSSAMFSPTEDGGASSMYDSESDLDSQSGLESDLESDFDLPSVPRTNVKEVAAARASNKQPQKKGLFSKMTSSFGSKKTG